MQKLNRRAQVLLARILQRILQRQFLKLLIIQRRDLDLFQLRLGLLEIRIHLQGLLKSIAGLLYLQTIREFQAAAKRGESQGRARGGFLNGLALGLAETNLELFDESE